jgi:cellulose biosynthesis protein BcsQ
MKTKLITYFNIKGGIYKTSMSIITAYELAKGLPSTFLKKVTKVSST